ncbi:MAG: c-type cytochrome [Anaerolineae bacterium]|nr:c-type cytochrome [Anaerolineae bacterium]
MNKRLAWILIIVGAVLVGIILTCLVGAFLFFSPLSRTTRPAAVVPELPQGYASNGETIYFTGVNDRGQRIPFTGGPMWLSMHGGGCASCHGPDGRGGAPVMMGTEIPLDIRYHHLIEEEHEEEHEEGEVHPPYTDETIKRAITEGVEPDGEPMDLTMPRWQMSERDLDDLLEFLKTLD